MHTHRLSNRTFVGLPVVAAALLVGCSEPPEPVEIIRPARVMRIAEPGEISQRWLPGRARASEEVNLSFDVSGTVLERPVFVGDRVSFGQVLARLDARDFENELQASVAARDRARANYERIQIAAESGAVSRQDLDDALAQLEVREADVRIRQKAVEDTVITAPRGGAISATFVEAFTSIQAKEPIVRLLNATSIEMVVQVPENLISNAAYVEQAIVEFDAFPGRQLTARIKEIGNEASLATRTFPVTVIMDQPDDFEVIPGMAGRARAVLTEQGRERSAGFQLPLAAVFTSNDAAEAGRSYIWVVDETNNTVRRSEVMTGPLTRFGIAVLSGVQTGDLVVISGVNFLTEGQSVRPTEPGASL